ncbi:MAG TPA: ABC transporter permease [Methylomirabilota bacterium]|jgi:putative spermidine/putrescine transport system permease protein|nr:ABC transporter permease [Methylomirabilota bacterium]
MEERTHPLLWLATGLACAYLAVPSLLVIVMSFSGGLFLEFPPSALSMRWYHVYWSSGSWLNATVRSLEVALAVTALATSLGTLASIALVRLAVPGKSGLRALVVSPIVVPTIVLSIGLYSVYARWRLIGTAGGLVLAHSVLALPFVVLNVTAVLYKLDRSLERAARSLGAGPLRTFAQVMLPLLWPGIASGAIFAFLTSFDEIVIAMFVSGSNPTLPKLMFDGIRYELNPVVAAVSSQLIIVTALALLGSAWLRRRTDQTSR